MMHDVTTRISRRHAAASFGPGDRFCAVWGFVDLLPEATDAGQ